MFKTQRFKEQIYPIVILILFAVGVLIALFETLACNDFILLKATSESFLFLNYLALILLVFGAKLEYKFWFWFVFSTILTIILEIIGVKTGLIFGEYFYGQTFILQIAGVPLLIGLCWSIIALGSIQIAEQMSKNSFAQIFIAGLIGLISDIIIEPVAIQLDYWKWSNDLVPLQNYMAWFLITIFLISFYKMLRIELDLKMVQIFFLVQLTFLTLVNLIFRWPINF